MNNTTKIRIITPVVSRRSRPSSSQDEYSERIKRLAGLCSETEVDRVRIEKGPPSIESRYDDAMATPDVLRLIKEAEGVDGIVVNCFCDPGVKAGREITDIPVIGPCLASMLVASSICDRFSILTVLKEVSIGSYGGGYLQVIRLDPTTSVHVAPVPSLFLEVKTILVMCSSCM